MLPYRFLILIGVSLCLFAACTTTKLNGQQVQIQQSSPMDNHKDHELRGVWVSTVLNLDWPSKPGLNANQQKNELEILFDSLEYAGFNAVFFQVRPESDAFYASDLEPWSHYLSGQQGEAPKPFYDPLSYAISLARERGMELHAWLNPFRTARAVNFYRLSDEHVVKKHPDWILTFRNGETSYSMLNPGIKEVRDYVSTVVADIVRRYDVDGIHFDDYFYPYSPAISTEDRIHFTREPRGITAIEDWRRDNINLVVEQVRDSIYAIDPMVKYGISPFAIRLNSDAGTNGSEGYHMIYADPVQWLEKGTIDYIAPQIYWERSHPVAPYKPIMEFWAKTANDNGRHIYVGMAPYRLSAPHNWSISEIGEMLQLNRLNEYEVHGNIHFRAQNISRNIKGLADSLSGSWNSRIAKIPVMKWKPIDNQEPVESLSVKRSENGSIELEWISSASARVAYIYRYSGSMSIDDIVSAGNAAFLIGKTGGTNWTDTTTKRDESYLYSVTVVGKNSEESIPRLVYID
jgi:uncharacterized lipoprotein YddW (UPF0748 family)